MQQCGQSTWNTEVPFKAKCDASDPDSTFWVLSPSPRDVRNDVYCYLLSVIEKQPCRMNRIGNEYRDGTQRDLRFEKVLLCVAVINVLFQFDSLPKHLHTQISLVPVCQLLVLLRNQRKVFHDVASLPLAATVSIRANCSMTFAHSRR